MVKNALLGILLGLLLQPVLADAADFVLIDEKAGIAPAPLVLFADAPPLTRKAAVELADYIEKTCGARPEVIDGDPKPLPERAIWVGFQPVLKTLFPKTDFDFKHPEEILIAANEKHLVIAGRDRWDPKHLVVEAKRDTVNGIQREYGTANAVYTFLQDYLGVRWLWPSALGEDIVPRKTIAFAPFVHRYHPQLRARSKLFGFSVLLRHSAYGHSGDWARRQRIQLDSLDVHPGHAFKDWWERFHKTQPEYFALQPDGTRSGFPAPELAKLCVSNPDVWNQWMADVEQQIRHNPNLTVFHAAPNDSYGSGHCVCEKCRAWDHPEADLRPFIWQGRTERAVALSDRDVKFANMCARLLKSRYPDEDYHVSMNAYGNARPAPLKTVPDGNVMVSNVANNFWSLDIPDKDCLKGKTYSQHYADWGKLTENQVWRPNTGNPAGWQNALPDAPVERVMASFQFAMDNHCMGVIVDMVWEHWATQGPLYYVLGQMTWNPSQDWRVVLNDYYQRGFGPAADEVKDYWTLLEESRNRKVDQYPGEENGYAEVYNKAFFDRAYGLLDQATKKAANAPDIYRERVGFLRVGLDHTRLITELRGLSLRMLQSGGEDADVADQVRAKWEEVERNSDRLPYAIHWPTIRPNNTRMARGGLFHPDFMEFYKAKHLAAWRSVGKKTAPRPATEEVVRLRPAEEAGWTLAFSDNFDREKLGDDWRVVEGNWTVSGGWLRGSGTLISTDKFTAETMPGYQRLEFEAVTGVAATANGSQPRVCDLSSFIHCDSKDEDKEPWKSGYFFQFGGRFNTQNQLARGGASLRTDSAKRIIPGKTHRIVVENDEGTLRFFVDGEVVFVESEKQSIIGENHNHVGFYFYTAAKVKTVKVYMKELPNDLDLD